MNFWDRVDRSGGPEACWPWTGCRDRQGYGSLTFDRKLRLAHRVAAFLSEVIPVLDDAPDNRVLHQCDNPPCCNPAHLRRGDNGQNQREAYARGLRISYQLRGAGNSNARLTSEQVLAIRAEYANGVVTQTTLGLKYKVSRGTIKNVVRRRHYADVV